MHRVIVRRDGEWTEVMWGSAESEQANLSAAESATRDAVAGGALDGMDCASSALARVALFSPMVGAEIEHMIRATQAWAERTCRAIAESEVAAAIDAAADMLAPAAEDAVSAAIDPAIDVAIGRLRLSLFGGWRWWLSIALTVASIFAATALVLGVGR